MSSSKDASKTRSSARKPESSKVAASVTSRRVGASRSRLGGASRLSASSSRRGNAAAPQTKVVVMHNGLDATPQSLLPARAGETPGVGKGFSANRSQLSAAGSQSQSSDNVMDRLSSGFSRSGLSARSGGSAASDEEDGYDLASPLVDDAAEDETEIEAAPLVVEQEALELSPAALDENIVLTLTETPTITLFHIPGVRVQKDTEEEKAVLARNERYDAFASAHGKGGDMYVVKHTQTVNNALKHKEVMAAPPATRDAGVNATTWDIHDCFAGDEAVAGEGEELEHGGKDATKDAGDGLTEVERQVEEIVAASLASPGCLLDAEAAVVIGPPGAQSQTTSNKSNKRAGDPSKPKKADGAKGGAAGASASRSHAGGTATPTSSSSKDTNRVGGGNNSASRSSLNASSGGRVPTSNSAAGDAAGSGGGGGGAGGGAAAPDAWGDAKEGRDVMVARESARVLSSRALLNSLRTVERAIQQNAYNVAHRLYRAVPGAEAEFEAMKQRESGDSEAKIAADSLAAAAAAAAAGRAERAERLEKLWTYECFHSEGRNVSCMVWNRVNPDLLAVSYSQFDFVGQKEGRIMLWSMKNPEYPECVLRTASGVTTLDFSNEHPNLLAAGLYDGSVCIYDVRKVLAGETDGTPALASESLAGHTNAVWQVKWVPFGDRGERLVSISSDGRVAQWSMKKGLTCENDLMVLKRVRNTLSAPEQKNDGVISRVASGLCMDFPEADTSIYFAGTEDGVIHKCSISYNEQDLDSYLAHAGPVNKFRCSPFVSSVCLSCSADWTVKLWDVSGAEQKTPTTFQTTDVNDSVFDVAWSPLSSTVFASVTGDGKIQLWDASSLSPLVSITALQESGDSSADGAEKRAPKKLTCVSFAQNAPVLVTGDSNGKVDVYRILGVDLTYGSKDDQCAKLRQVLGLNAVPAGASH